MSTPERTSNLDERCDAPWLIIDKLPYSISEQQLLTLIGRYGQIQELRILPSVECKTLNLGLRMSTFWQTESVLEAVTSLQTILEDVIVWPVADLGRKLAEGVELHDSCASNNIYIENVPAHWTDAELMELFGCYGEILQCRILSNRSPGYSFSAAPVQMHSAATATKTIQALNGLLPVNYHMFANPQRLRLRYADTPQEKAVRRLRKDHLA